MKRAYVAGAAVLAVVLVAVFYLASWKPTSGKIDQANQARQEAQSEESRLRAQIARLEELKRRAPEIQAEIAQFSEKIPDTPDLPGFIRRIVEISARSGVDVNSISPGAPSPLTAQSAGGKAVGVGGVNVIQVALAVEGGYFQMSDFLSRLESLQRATQVISVSLTPGAPGAGGMSRMTSALSMKIYTTGYGPGFQPAPAGGVVLPTATASPTPTPSAR
ncbi:MAG: type 4a pilus biogenesis protein PilO [Actinomycetota bacterium]